METRYLDGKSVAAIAPGGSNRAEKIEEAKRQRQSMTRAETRLWERLRAGRFLGLHFRRQHVLGGFIADFYCHAHRLVIEVDGSAHAERHDYDTERTAILERCGLRVVRFTNNQVIYAIDDVLAEIQAIVQPTPALPKREGGDTRLRENTLLPPASGGLGWARGSGQTCG